MSRTPSRGSSLDEPPCSASAPLFAPVSDFSTTVDQNYSAVEPRSPPETAAGSPIKGSSSFSRHNGNLHDEELQLGHDATDGDGADPKAPSVMDARAYQLEMFQQSRQRNVIVAVCRPTATLSSIF
jgi:hypothetical protein